VSPTNFSLSLEIDKLKLVGQSVMLTSRSLTSVFARIRGLVASLTLVSGAFAPSFNLPLAAQAYRDGFPVRAVSGLGAQTWKFDFGPGSLAPGYQRVMPQNIYSRQAGFGFEPGPQPDTNRPAEGSVGVAGFEPATAGTQSRPSRVLFILAGIAALYVSSDETAQIHERVHALIGARYIDWVPPFIVQNFFFVMVFVAVLVSIGQMLSKDLLALWTHHRRIVLLTLLGVAIGLTGGMVVESVGYQIPPTHPILYRVEVTVEEFMEMFGGSVILLAALQLRRRLAIQRLTTLRQPRLPRVRTTPEYRAVS